MEPFLSGGQPAARGLEALVVPGPGGACQVRRTRAGNRILLMTARTKFPVAVASTSGPSGQHHGHGGYRASPTALLAAAVVVATPGWLQRPGFLPRVHGAMPPGGLLLAVDRGETSTHPYVQRLLTRACTGAVGANMEGDLTSGDGCASDGQGVACAAAAEIGVWNEPELLQTLWTAGFDHGEVVCREHLCRNGAVGEPPAALVLALKNPLPPVHVMTSAISSPQRSKKHPKQSSQQCVDGPAAAPRTSFPPPNPFLLQQRQADQHILRPVLVSECRRYFDPAPSYLTDGTFPSMLAQQEGEALCTQVLARRLGFFTSSLRQFRRYDAAARALSRLPPRATRHLITDQATLCVGDRSTELDQPRPPHSPKVAVGIEDGGNKATRKQSPSSPSSSLSAAGGGAGGETESEWAVLCEVLEGLKPWKKGPLRIFGVDIDAEWRSDWKWDRIRPYLAGNDSLRDKAVADIGCANGYFRFRMLEEKPRIVVGIDPNLKVTNEPPCCNVPP